METVYYIVSAIAVFWIGMLSAAMMGGLYLLILIMLFVTLKLIGIISWSWWWVLLPGWAVIGSSIAKIWIVTRDPMWRYR
jgi:hypothetical protein